MTNPVVALVLNSGLGISTARFRLEADEFTPQLQHTRSLDHARGELQLHYVVFSFSGPEPKLFYNCTENVSAIKLALDLTSHCLQDTARSESCYKKKLLLRAATSLLLRAATRRNSF